VRPVGEDLYFALELADLADSLTLPRFRSVELAVETKPDLTPVTEADRAAEHALRERIRTERPGDAILGEELGAEGDGDRRWLLDPIDGTKNYSRGIPIFATLIALERGAEVEVGAVSAPALGRRWWASRGDGAYANGTRIRVSQIERVEECVFSFDRTGLRGNEGVRELFERCWHARTFSDFWQHILVAEGSVDVAFDAIVNPWDLAALQVIVEEAGGRLTDGGGARRIDGGSGLSTNVILHQEALRFLGRAQDHPAS
jgi:histidinol-phosphatase